MEDTVDQSEQTSDTSVAEESAPQAEASEAPEQKAQAEEPKEEKLPPFHEHPRFKEVIEQNRGYKTQLEQYQGALERLQNQMETLRQQATPKKEAPIDPFLADLEKVNPEYAKSLKAVYERAQKAEQIEQRMQQYEAQQFAEKAQNHFNKLMESGKVTDPWDKKVYEKAIRAEVYEREARGQKLGLNDLDKIFNEFHSEYSKMMEDRNRKLTASYVQEKAKDKTPKATTGGAATAPTAKKIAANDIAGQAKWLADQIRAQKKTI